MYATTRDVMIRFMESVLFCELACLADSLQICCNNMYCPCAPSVCTELYILAVMIIMRCQAVADVINIRNIFMIISATSAATTKK